MMPTKNIQYNILIINYLNNIFGFNGFVESLISHTTSVEKLHTFLKTYRSGFLRFAFLSA